MKTGKPQVSFVQPTLLSQINEWRVLRAIRREGPMSRAEVARFAGITPPTASKTVEALLKAGWLIEEETPENGQTQSRVSRGRPARKLRFPAEEALVLGLVIDAPLCAIVAAGLDGKLIPSATTAFPTPTTYVDFLDTVTRIAVEIVAHASVPTLGMGISLPGLMDYSRQRSLLSPNVPITNGQSPVRDLSERLGLPCVMLQEQHALCLSERLYGSSRDLDDFVLLDTDTGVGLGVVTGGRMLTGSRGLAGEYGHFTVTPDGKPCGCGNRGCLETEISDLAFAQAVGERLGRDVHPGELVGLLEAGEPAAHAVLERIVAFFGIAVAGIINLYNPQTVALHGHVVTGYAPMLGRVIDATCQRALRPSFENCQIRLVQGSKPQGAIGAIIEHLLSKRLPAPLHGAQDFVSGPELVRSS